MSDGKTLYKVLSQETKKTAAGKSYVNARSSINSDKNVMSRILNTSTEHPFVKGIFEIKGKYKNLMNVDETTEPLVKSKLQLRHSRSSAEIGR